MVVTTTTTTTTTMILIIVAIIVLVPVVLRFWSRGVSKEYLRVLSRWPVWTLIVTLVVKFVFIGTTTTTTATTAAAMMTSNGSSFDSLLLLMSVKWVVCCSSALLLLGLFLLVPASYRSPRRASRMSSDVTQQKGNAVDSITTMRHGSVMFYVLAVVYLYASFGVGYMMLQQQESSVLESIIVALSYWTVCRISLLYFESNILKSKEYLVETPDDDQEVCTISQHLQQSLYYTTRSEACMDSHSIIYHCPLCLVAFVYQQGWYQFLYNGSFLVTIVVVLSGWIFMMVMDYKEIEQSGTNYRTENIVGLFGFSLVLLGLVVVYATFLIRSFLMKKITNISVPVNAENDSYREDFIRNNGGNRKKSARFGTSDAEIIKSSESIAEKPYVEMKKLGKQNIQSDSVLTISTAASGNDYYYNSESSTTQLNASPMRTSQKIGSAGIKKNNFSASVATLVPPTTSSTQQQNTTKDRHLDKRRPSPAITEASSELTLNNSRPLNTNTKYQAPLVTASTFDYVEAYEQTKSEIEKEREVGRNNAQNASITLTKTQTSKYDADVPSMSVNTTSSSSSVIGGRKSKPDYDALKLAVLRKGEPTGPSTTEQKQVHFAETKPAKSSTLRMSYRASLTGDMELSELDRLQSTLLSVSSKADVPVSAPVRLENTTKHEKGSSGSLSAIPPSMLADSSILTPTITLNLIRWLESPNVLNAKQPLIPALPKDAPLTVPFLLQRLLPLFQRYHPVLFLHFQRAIIQNITTARKRSLTAILPNAFDRDKSLYCGDRKAVDDFKLLAKEVLHVDDDDLRFSSTFETTDDVKKCLFVLLRFYVASNFKMKRRGDKSAEKSTQQAQPDPHQQSFKERRKSKFEARQSIFDAKFSSEFRGFFVLFWIAIGIQICTAFLGHYRREGSPLKLSLLPVFTHDLIYFAITDAVIVLGSFVCVPLHSLLFKGYVSPTVSVILKHVIQALYMLGMTAWILLREFQWPQATTLCLHTVVMYMKMHSYLTCNFEFELERRELERVQNDISILSGQISSVSKDRPESSPSRNGRSWLGSLFGSSSNSSSSNVSSDLRSKEEREVKLLELREHEERLQLNLKAGPNSYPETFTLANFIDFLLVPTLVYELYYPREERPVRIRYIVEKVMGALGIFATLYFILEHYIYPVLLESHNITLVECILQLLIPMLMSWLLVFYIIFECVCNTFAEITGFADRQFYDYWWNSCSFDEFARTWNKPVHEFLLRHIYLEAIDSYKLSKHNATFLTFLFSSCLHEFAVAVVARKVKMFFFFLQMTQIPLIWIGRATYIKQKPVLGNVVFWLSLISGLPLLASLYTREEFLRQQGLVGDIWFWPEGLRF